MDFIKKHLEETVAVAREISQPAIKQMVEVLLTVRENHGRLFLLGVGGSAANASHAVNDFRKLCGLEAYTPVDNVSELTARTNDEGWESVFAAWLEVSHLRPQDAILVLSVGGGNLERNVSGNLVLALQFAKRVGAKILGIVGRDGGYTAQVADVCCRIPVVNPAAITPHSEAFQSVILHLVVSHPLLKNRVAKWESLSQAPAPMLNP